jgi:hypothetical protein
MAGALNRLYLLLLGRGVQGVGESLQTRALKFGVLNRFGIDKSSSHCFKRLGKISYLKLLQEGIRT